MARNTSPNSFEYARPKRSLGQNFLVDISVIGRIVTTLGNLADRNVIEIGPGRGALTRPLIDAGAKLTVVELDDDLASKLAVEYSTEPDFRCIHTNVLDLDFSSIGSADTVIVGNLPYYISTPIIRHLIRYRAYFSRLVLMLQREVAQRICAEPSDSERGFLTVLVEQYLRVSSEFDVPPTVFLPRPKVWSSIVSLEPRAETIDDDPAFERLVSAAFNQKRKTLLNNLRNYHNEPKELLVRSSIDPKRRAETLSREEWVRLFNTSQELKRA